MQLDVINRAKKNIVYGFLSRIVLMLCPFFTRTAIQYILNSQYLGLSSLFNSIILVLSLAELGFSSAVVYNMYKPANDGDIEKINALLNYFKKAYRIIGLVIGAVGLMIIPILPQLISGSYPEDIDLTKLYLIFLFNTVISYFLFSYLSSIIVVYQREDINSSCYAVSQLALTVLQIVALKLTHSFYCFALLIPLFTIVNNLWVAWRVHRLFPQYSCRGQVDKETKKEIKKIVVGTFIHKACTTLRFSIDSICISVLLGLTATAIYSNYTAIWGGVAQILLIITTSFAGGVGNHVVSRTVDENYQELKKIGFSYMWISGWCAICMLCIFQPFMELWMGKDMLIGMDSVLMLSVLFYFCKLGDVRFLYYSANGLWWHNRWRALAETALNIILNIVLGLLLGIKGIILATLIAFISCNSIWSTRILFREYFGLDKISDYFIFHLKQIVVLVLAGALCYFTVAAITPSNIYITLLLRAAICVVIPNIIFLLIYRKTSEFEYLIKSLKKRPDMQ